METAQQQHNRISLMRVDSGLEYLRQKQREKDGRSIINSSVNQPSCSFTKPTAYVYPNQYAPLLPPAYTTNPIHAPSGVLNRKDYPRNVEKGNLAPNQRRA